MARAREPRHAGRCRWRCWCEPLAVGPSPSLLDAGEVFNGAGLRFVLSFDWSPRLSERRPKQLGLAFQVLDYDADSRWLYPSGLRMASWDELHGGATGLCYWRHPLLDWAAVLAVLRRYGVRHVSGVVGVVGSELEEPEEWTPFEGALPALRRAP